jgi:hypothetical protein
MTGTSRQKAHKILVGVKIGKTFAKWGNLNENLLNRVISIKKLKLGGKTGIYSTFNIPPPSNITNMFGNWFNGVDRASKDQFRTGI